MVTAIGSPFNIYMIARMYIHFKPVTAGSHSRPETRYHNARLERAVALVGQRVVIELV